MDESRTRWKVRLLALASASVLALAMLWLLELGLLALAGPDPALDRMRTAEAAGNPFDLRSRREVVADLRAEGVAAVPRLVPAALLEGPPDGPLRSMLTSDGGEILPLAGISNTTTVLCNETGRYAVYESDEHGFRNPFDAWPEPPVDLVLLGDSFTIGECVAPGETIADRLRTRWPRTLNLGYSGHSPLFELATLIEYAGRLEPRTTLWLFFENDFAFFDLARSARSPLLMRYLEAGFTQGLAGRQSEIDERLRSLLESGLAEPDDASPFHKVASRRDRGDRALLRFLALARLRWTLAKMRGVATLPTEAPDEALVGRILRRGRDHVARWQGDLVVVFLPGVWRFPGRRDTPGWSHPHVTELLQRRTAVLGLRFIDMEPVFARHPEPRSLYSFPGESDFGSPHLNAGGYALVAAELSERLAAASSEPVRGDARLSQISRQ